LRGPVETGQYLSGDYTQTLADHDVLASVGSTGDAYDNSMAESFVDSFKTELIADRVWRTRSQLELAIVEYISWFNDSRLHENLDDRSPAEIEELYAVKPGQPHPRHESENLLIESPWMPVRLIHRRVACAPRTRCATQSHRPPIAVADRPPPKLRHRQSHPAHCGADIYTAPLSRLWLCRETQAGPQRVARRADVVAGGRTSVFRKRLTRSTRAPCRGQPQCVFVFNERQHHA
jgi:hypothetical protein